jgi:hypothetical protein
MQLRLEMEHYLRVRSADQQACVNALLLEAIDALVSLLSTSPS